ncbi:BatA domain-containing protein [Polaribacter septentrionalilitoris]|uniref:BatA domain-containing protein n=1 Tax=Polaribacter septentrionalilitoris TaxID=2494657 RepID=UPI0013594E1E|nr:BatA domain-containing protein [Polaribacter septentrionalilitoris]
MQFKNPEILYFLALLIIPILVHLFQLQKFVKIPFTNVAFLQQLEQQTRKSSRIKKWLILACRLLLFSAILFAFSQPYLSNKKAVEKLHTFIYLDNSLSTDSKGEKGKLLQISAQEIIKNTSENDIYSLQTNTNFYKNITKKELKDILLRIKNTAKSLNFNSIYLKNKQNQSYKIKTLSNLIYISDFQNNYKKEFTNVTPSFSAINLETVKKENISIDSVFVNERSSSDITINIIIKNQGTQKKNIPIAISSKSKLISKQSFSIDKDSKKTIEFKIQNQSEIQGKINITYNDTFSFDNTFFFTLKKRKKINILAIGNELNFLDKIYTKEEFNYTFSPTQNVNYNNIKNQNLIILSEAENIPEILSNRLVEFIKNGGNIVIIPNSKSNNTSYNNLLSKLQIGKIESKQQDSLKITKINFNHPLLKNVFVKQVQNFQYPIVNEYYTFKKISSSNAILTFENNQPFIQQFNKKNGNVFLIASPLNRESSNFINSPLVVPVFYNFAQSSFKQSDIFYRLHKENNIDIEITTNKDDVLTIASKECTFIPLQRKFQNKVRITTNDKPEKSGFYHILKNKDTLETIAFNNPKSESSLSFLDLNELKSENSNITVSNSITSVFNNLNKKNKVHWLWKWFLALAIVSLLLEILILKFYKT